MSAKALGLDPDLAEAHAARSWLSTIIIATRKPKLDSSVRWRWMPAHTRPTSSMPGWLNTQGRLERLPPCLSVLRRSDLTITCPRFI